MKKKLAVRQKNNIKGLYYMKVKSRHPSHNQIRRALQFDFPTVVRFGSTTEVGPGYVQVNEVEAIKNSASKIRMKKCFTTADVNSAKWYKAVKEGNKIKLHSHNKEDNGKTYDLKDVPLPLVIKHEFGSRNRGNTLVRDLNALTKALESKEGRFSDYVIEEYFGGAREYRLHVNKDRCFYTCRKMLKEGTPENERWYRNDSNCTWILEENNKFDKPINWQSIEQDCIKALKAVGLDVGAVDLKVQSAKDDQGKMRRDPKYKVLEINSAPSFGEKTTEKYKEELKLIIRSKKNNQ